MYGQWWQSKEFCNMYGQWWQSKECLNNFISCKTRELLLLLTGEVQTDRAAELLGLRPCGFRPQHSSKLGNESRMFTNYDPGMRLRGWELGTRKLTVFFSQH
ncbi:hypothetical protein Dsin_006980 [Dipteronia sinensis]|uniref:Uncharacterized protein n=1 Tax=Dipteronia sinensis TaxID=43782 RepID=A0AAE0B0B3_9ROSI|nr:hypothetical protein Dsin_006980 [Dipteronia sinensis]